MKPSAAWKGEGSIATPCFSLEPDVPTTCAAKRSAVPGRVAAKRGRLPERAKGSRGDRSALLQEKSEQTEVELLQFKSLQFADTSRKALESRKNTVNAALARVSDTEYPPHSRGPREACGSFQECRLSLGLSVSARSQERAH